MMLLCDSFPSLYTLAESKEVWDYLGEEDGRNLQFTRPFNDRKVDVVEQYNIREEVSMDLEDRMSWRRANFGEFSMKCLYEALEIDCTAPFPWRPIWNPCHVTFFALEAL